MLLKNLIKSQYKKVVIDDVELKIKKLTWGELKNFEAEAKKLDVVSAEEGANEADSTIALCKYIFKNFVRDEKEDLAIAEEDIESLPVEFCVKLLETFVASVRGEDAEDIKKN